MSTVGATTQSSSGSVTVLKCTKLSKSYTGAPQFSEVNMNLGRGQRVGLIGVNGAGGRNIVYSYVSLTHMF